MMTRLLETSETSRGPELKSKWISQINDFASRDIISVLENSKVIEQFDDIFSRRIDYIIVRNSERQIRGVVPREDLNEIVSDMILAVRTNRLPERYLAGMTFGDLVEKNALADFYLIDRSKDEAEPNLWLEGLPPREVVIVRDSAVESVVDRRWFKRWQSMVRFSRFRESRESRGASWVL